MELCVNLLVLMFNHQILAVLNEQEVKLVVPTHSITPRTFVLKPGMVLFLGALARIDYLEVRFFTLFAFIFVQIMNICVLKKKHYYLFLSSPCCVLQGNQPCWFTVVASSQIPVHITSLDKADFTYQKHAGETLLTVSLGWEGHVPL